MKTIILIISLAVISACSFYEDVKDIAGDTYEWSKEKKDQAVEVIEEAVSE